MNSFKSLWVSLGRASAYIAVIISFSCSSEYLWDSAITTGKLDNGLEYAIYNSNKSSDPFNIRLIVNAGSVDEATRPGVAHMLEHMVFHKTQAHPEGMHTYIDSLGWKTGLQVNAVTRQTETQYMVRTRPNDSLDMAGSLAFLSQLAGFATLDKADWQRERGVIIEEWRQGDGLAGEVNNLKKAVVRNGSRYVDRPTIGTRASIEAATIEELRDFYNQFYVASNMQLVVSGNVNVVQTQQAIANTFGKLPTKPKPNRDYVALPLAEQLYIDKVQHPKGTTSMVVYGLRLPMPDRASEHGQYAYLQNYFLRKLMRNQVMRNRAFLPKDKAESISLTVKEPTNERLVVAIAARTADHALGLKLVTEEYARLYRDGLDEQDFNELVEKAKGITQRNVTAAKHRDYMAWEDKITEALMKGAPLEEPAVRTARTLKWLEQMTLEQLNARMRDILDAEDNFIYYQAGGTQKLSLPTVAQVRQLEQNIQSNIDSLPKSISLAVKRSAEAKVANQQAAPEANEVTADQVTEPLLSKLPKVTTAKADWYALESEQWSYQDETITLHKYLLGNGDKLLWLDKSTSDNKLYIKALSSAGYQNNQISAWQAQAGVQLWQQSGLPQWNEQQWQNWQQTQPHWQWQLKESELDLAAVIAPSQLASLMQLYHLRMQSGIDKGVWQQVKADLVSQSRTHKKSRFISQQRFGQSMLDDVTAQAVDAVTEERIIADTQSILRQPTTFYIVGQLDHAELEQQMAQHLANVPRQASLSNSTTMQLPANRLEHIVTHEQDKAEVSLFGYTPMQWTPEQAFLVSTLTPIAKKMLKKKLRHELGGIYSIKYEMSLNPRHDRIETEVHFTCAPERSNELIAAAKQVLTKLGDSVSEQNLQRTVEDIAFAEQGRLTSANTWLRRMILSDKRYQNASYIQRAGRLHELASEQRLKILAKQIFPMPHQMTFVDKPNGLKL
ncbi:insulinase family protein [Shewanella sp. WXL01]|uniref:M16 family metallopeptidase n=1 Tax=Shewanella sp. WXL01 TaxID=2709721 RepID=UPI0014384F9F|nr:insulinase family protein [Shewanella sp. WXL01]NKF49131.1 insulinase family protein [Shewanella sp. WXL01]